MPDPTKIPSPSDILGKNSIPSPSDILGDNEKKKSTSTVKTQKSVSETPIGSSGGKGFPKIDTNSVAPGLGVQPKVSVAKIENNNKTKVPPKEEVESFLGGAINRLDRGIASVSKSIYDMPSMLYDLGIEITSPTMSAVSKVSGKSSSEILAKELNFKNIPSKMMEEKIKRKDEEINNYRQKIGGDITTSYDNGDYVNTFKHAALNSIESAPLIALAMATGGESAIANLAVGTSTASTQYDQLNKQHPELDTKSKLSNSAISGISEVVVGKFIEGVSGNVWKNLLLNKGEKEAVKIVTNSFKKTMEKVIGKSPIVGVAAEYTEERVVDAIQQYNDINTGIQAEFNMNQNRGAGLSSTGFSVPNTIGVYGAKGYIKSKTYSKVKATNKEVFKLRSEIENGNLSDENKAILRLRADRLEAENKKLLGTEIEKVKALPSDVKTELNALNEEFESLKSKFDDIDDADDIPDNLKPAMKEEIRIQAAKNQKRKTEILSQNDGLEVDNDFSNFDGVEPDFNLENGKISSLPLKEQDRLNDQALQELTGGDMSIEVTKEQVSQKANEIYTNEQTPPTSETKPQAEAEKVDQKPTTDKDGYLLPVGEEINVTPTDELRDSTEISQNQEVSDVEKRREDEKKNLDSDLLNYNEGESSIIGQGLKEIRDDIVNAERKGLISYKDKQLAQAKMNLWLGAGMSLQEVAEKIKEQFGINVSGGKWTLKEIKLQQINAKYDAELESLKTKETPKPQEVSPVEDVVATSVEKPLSSQELSKDKVDSNSKKFNIEGKDIFHHASDSKRNGRLKISNAPQFGTGVYFSTNKELVENEYGSDNTTSVKLNIENPVYSGSKEWNEVNSLAIEKADKDYGEKKGLKLNEDETYFRYNKDNLSEIDEIPSKFISDAAKELGYDAIIDKGSNEYENEVVVLDESKIIYPEDEATPETNTPTNGNVQLGASNVGESGNAKPKSNSKSSVPSSVDGGEVKGDASVGKIIEPHSEVNTDVETVKKELKLNEVESLIYDSFKGISKDETVDKVDDIVEKWKDNKFGEIEAIESKINDIDIKLEDNGIEIDQINYAENMTAAKKKKAVAAKEKEYDDLQKQQKELEEQKEAVNESLKQIDDVLFHPTEDYNIDLINEVVDKVNNRLETRKSIKEGTNLFPEDANIPEFVAVKKELIKLTDEKTIAEFNNRTAEQIEESKPIIKDIESKAENAERISKKELEKGIDDAEKLLKKPTTKERIAERIKLSDAKVDNIKDAINGIDSIFGIKIKVDDIEGLNKNGIDIVEVIANIAKQAIAAGIHIDEAINKTIEHLKKTIDFDVNIDDIKEKINPKVEEEKKADNDFKTKSGKKSLLGRLIQGGNPDVITKAVKELGENYDVRNQQEANDEAIAFIDKVGASEALKAIKDGLITNSDVKMLIYDEALTRLKTEISDEINNNPEDREALIQKFQEVSDDFDKAIRDAGQGIAIMNYIYNKNQTLKYNLKKQISDWKRNDPNGEIPADVKAKFEELEQKLKDIEERTKVAEERAKKAEDDLAIKNIKEDVERKNQTSRKNKSGLTPQEQNRKKELRNKFARANDVTGIPALLVDPEFREYLGLVLKTAKGDFSNFSNEILKELGKSARQHLPELFANAGGKGDVKVTDLQSITINEEGKIKIPAQMLRDYVEQGYTDIDEIAALIKDDIADEFPDADVRDIRDALTGYGKQINPNKDEITAEVNKLKEYGRLLSAYDDVMNGQMPLKSGLKRPKSEQKARELRRNINRLAKELNLEPIDLEKQWANAIDKVKSHLKNQIEDLDKQIANGEKRKVERTSIKLDEEATALKTIRDAKKQILDDLVGKPELTEEQKIASAEKSLETSIKKIQEEIDTNDISFKEKPTLATSKKIEELKTAKKALLETKKQLRQEAGLIEQQRLKTAKTRIKNQIEDLNTRIKNKDFAKKEVKPILADNELNTLRAEKEAIYEEYEKMKYLQELKNRSRAKKIMDEGLEALGLARAVKASLDLGLIGIQLRGFTYSELWRNPKELGRKFIKLFGAIGSQNKTNKAMSELIGHPLHALAKKLDIGMTHPDLRNEVREEMASGNLLHFIWSSPVLAAEALGGKEAMNSKRASIGDSFIDSVTKQYNKLFKNYQVDIKQKEKFSIKEQWKNINAFEAVERGLSIYGNQLRFEEFVRGVERLKAEGKDEINHLEDYKLLASYIRTFSGRAKPAGFELNQKALNVFFFSFKNMASVMQQLNPIYYGLQHTNSTDFKNGNYFKPSVANKMAMATMFKSVVSTSATILFIMASYNAFKDDDEEEATLETDPRSSDFGKIKIGNFRADFWGGYIPLISLYARLLTEETKKSDGTIVKFGEGYGGIESRGDAATKFLINKESPGFQIFHKYMTSTEEVDKATGETYRVTPFGGKLSEEDAYSFYPMFIGSVKQAKEKDYEGVQAFLTAYSILGLGNVQEYEQSKSKTKGGMFKMPGLEQKKFKLPKL